MNSIAEITREQLKQFGELDTGEGVPAVIMHVHACAIRYGNRVGRDDAECHKETLEFGRGMYAAVTRSVEWRSTSTAFQDGYRFGAKITGFSETSCERYLKAICEKKEETEIYS